MSECDYEVVEAPEARIPFPLEPVLIDLEGGRYVSPILKTSLAEIVPGRWLASGSATRGGGGYNNSVSGNRKTTPTLGATGGDTKVRSR